VAYVLDGAMHNNPQDNLNMPFPFPDALQEFSVATERAERAERHALRRGGQRRDQVGHEPFSGNAFEFVRDRRFNATNPFAPIGPNGKRVDDGLQRNQFGGTLGGPLVRNKLFLLRRLSGTTVRQQPPPTSRGCRRPRCSPATSPASHRRPATAAGRSRYAEDSRTTASIRRGSVARRSTW
jgi:hypothetical protein